MSKLHNFSQQGQSLITLLFFVIIAVTITAAAVSIIVINARSTFGFAQGTTAYLVAESGIENAVIRFLRDPSYAGETLSLGSNGTATIVVSGSGPYTITSKGAVGNFIRTLQVTLQYTNNTASVSAWQEI